MHRLPLLALLVGLTSLAACASDPAPSPPAEPPTSEHQNPEDETAPPSPPDANAPKLVTIDLGTVQPNKAVTFDAPKGTLGFNIVGLPVSGDVNAMVSVSELVAPDGKKLVEDSVPEGTNQPYGYPGVAASSIPRGPSSVAMKDRSGTWTAKFEATEPLEVTVNLQVTGDGAFQGGELDVHVYIPVGMKIHDPGPMHDVSAATAPDDTAVKARLDTYFDALEKLFGISRGKVTFHEIGAEFITVDETNMAAALAETAAAKDGQAMHLLWTTKLTLFGNETWGVSPGAPGGAVKVGHPAAGIVIGLTSSFPAKGDGLTMLHETGHYLGLQHTTELAGGSSDPLEDTPVCDTISPESFRQCTDRTNLMFPVFYGATNGGKGVMLSDHQRTVVQGSPIYHAKTTARTQSQSLAAPSSLFDMNVAVPRGVVPCGNALMHR